MFLAARSLWINCKRTIFTEKQICECYSEFFYSLKVFAHWVRNFRPSKKIRIRFDFLRFASVACILIGNDREYEKRMHIQFNDFFNSTSTKLWMKNLHHCVFIFSVLFNLWRCKLNNYIIYNNIIFCICNLYSFIVHYKKIIILFISTTLPTLHIGVHCIRHVFSQTRPQLVITTLWWRSCAFNS